MENMLLPFVFSVRPVLLDIAAMLLPLASAILDTHLKKEGGIISAGPHAAVKQNGRVRKARHGMFKE